MPASSALLKRQCKVMVSEGFPDQLEMNKNLPDGKERTSQSNAQKVLYPWDGTVASCQCSLSITSSGEGTTLCQAMARELYSSLVIMEVLYAGKLFPQLKSWSGIHFSVGLLIQGSDPGYRDA